MEQVSYSLKELCRFVGITERTVRYYIKEGLLPPPNGSGPFSRYSYEHWLRLLFIRRLKEEFLPLNEIKKVLSGQSLVQLTELARRNGLLEEGASVAKEEVANRLESLVQPASNSLRQQLVPTALQEASVNYSVAAALEPQERGVEPLKWTNRPAPARPQPPMTNPLSPTMHAPGVPAKGVGFGQRLEPPVAAYRLTTAPPTFLPSVQVEPADEAAHSQETLGESWQRLRVAPGIELHIEKSILENLSEKRRPALEALLEAARRLSDQQGDQPK